MDPILSLIPITKIKISKENWLELPIKYDDELKVKDIIEEKKYLKGFNWKIKEKPEKQKTFNQQL